MEYYVGLDVSLKQTSICVVDQSGSVVREGVVDSDPEAISVYVRSRRRARYVSASRPDRRLNDRKRRPYWNDGDGEFDRFCASVRKPTAIATLNRQRHQSRDRRPRSPPCGADRAV